jgi:hypothetical protein
MSPPSLALHMKELAFSILRVWLFSPPILDLPCSDIKELLPIIASTATYKQVAQRMFLLGFCSSQLTKAALHFQNQLLSNRKSSKFLGSIHMILGSILLPKKSNVRYFPFQCWKLILHSMILGVMGMLLDELITIWVMFLTNKKFKVCGRKYVGEAECMICLQTSKELDCFCPSSHTAHKSCMARWYKPLGMFSKCPMCRQRMDISVEKVLHFGWIDEVKDTFLYRISISMQTILIINCVYFIHSYLFKWRLQLFLKRNV